MNVPRENWAAVFGLRNEVIDATHPDYDYWYEADEIDRWLSDGAPQRELPPKSSGPERAPIEPLAYSMKDAATALGVSEDAFRQHVQAELKIVRRGRLKRVSRAELQKWLDRAAETL